MADRPRVLVSPADDYGCGRFRLRWPAEILKRQGANVHINRFGGREEIPIRVERDTTQAPVYINGRARHPVVSVKDFDADVVVLQRPATENLLRTITLMQEKGKAVVVDVDDALWLINPKNLAYRGWDDKTSPVSNWRWLLRCCRQADLVTTTTPKLQEKLGGIVLPNYVPGSYLKIGKERGANKFSDGVVVGWGGTMSTHPEDIETTHGTVAQAVRESGTHFVALGGSSDEMEAFGFKEGDSAFSTGPIDINRWPYEFAHLDISLVPLKDCQFNDAKSWLKGMESAALGAVPVMSPSPDNVRLNNLGVGVLAKRPRQWRSLILELAMNDTYREELSERGTEVMRRMTYEENAWLWEEAWDRAWRIRKGLAPPIS